LFGNAETRPGDNAIESLEDCQEFSALKTMTNTTVENRALRALGRAIHAAAQSALVDALCLGSELVLMARPASVVSLFCP
jgi:hypothetical protein